MSGLEEIADRIAIEDVLVRYATAIDARDLALLDSVFAPDARIDVRSAGGIAASYEEFRGWIVPAMERYRVLAHAVSNVRVTWTGDGAESTCMLRAKHGVRGEGKGLRFFEIGGEYRDRLVRTAPGWRILERVFVMQWVDGDLDLLRP